MRKKSILVLFSIFAGALWSSGAMSQVAPNVDSKMIYANYIDKLIANSEIKTQLVESEFENLRKAGAYHCSKAEFLSRNKENLVRDMCAENISFKPHAIEYYVNNRLSQAPVIAHKC